MTTSLTELKENVILSSVAASNLTMGNTTGTTTVLGTTLINSTGGQNTTIGSVNAGTITVRGSTIGITGPTTINSTGGLNTTIGTDGTGTTILRGLTTTIGGTTIGLTGATTIVGGTASINATGGANTTIGTSATGETTVRGATTAISGTQINITGSTTISGGALINTTGGQDTTIGTSAQGTTTLRGATTTINGSTVGITSTSTLDLALGATSILNVGVVGRTNANADHHYSDGNNCIAGANVHINNGEKNKSTTRIQDGAGTVVGDSTGGVNILTGAFNTGTVEIGQFTIPVALVDNKTTTTIDGDINLAPEGGNVVIGADNAYTEVSMPSRTILIGNTTPSNNLNTIYIGVDTGTNRSTTIIDGDVVINETGGGTTTIGADDGTSTISVVGTINLNGVGSTDIGLITIGNITAGGITSILSPTINIGDSDTVNIIGTTNINTGTAGAVDIGNATNTTSINGITTNITGGTTNINTTLDGNTIIGNSSGTGNFTLNKPITTGYLPSTITSTQIGYKVKDTITTTTITSAAFANAFAPITLPAGVWLITYSLRFIPTASVTTGDIFTFSNINSTIAPVPPLQISGTSAVQTISTSGIVFGGTFVIPSDGTTTYTISFVVGFSGALGTTMSIQSDTSAYGSSVFRTKIA
jgi:hypothetical protein